MGYAAQVNSSFSGWPDLARVNSCELINVAKANRVAYAVNVDRTASPESAGQQRKLALVQSGLTFQPLIQLMHSPALSEQAQSTSSTSLVMSDVLSHEASSFEQYLWGAAWFLLGLIFLCTT